MSFFTRERPARDYGPPGEPVVFLDLDGVGNTTDSPHGWGHGRILPRFVPRLNRLTTKAGATIVLSTGWRVHLSHRVLVGQLQRAGITAPVTGQTPLLVDRRDDRWEEIADWLDEFGARPYVILDDIEDFGPLRARHVWTDPTVGLTEADVDLALRILKDQR